MFYETIYKLKLRYKQMVHKAMKPGASVPPRGFEFLKYCTKAHFGITPETLTLQQTQFEQIIENMLKDVEGLDREAILGYIIAELSLILNKEQTKEYFKFLNELKLELKGENNG